MEELSSLALQEAIRSRGYWDVVIRPAVFDQHRIPNYSDLMSIVQGASVRLRGWDFPHVDGNREHRSTGADWVGEYTEFRYHREVWRFAQSGLFVHLSAIHEDWPELAPDWGYRGVDAGTVVPLISTVFRFTEVFEFAARLSLSPGGADAMHVTIKLGNLRGRRLFMENPRRLLFNHYTTDLETFEFPLPGRDGRLEPLLREELIAGPRDLAVEASRALFQRFGFEADAGVLRDIQQELR